MDHNPWLINEVRRLTSDLSEMKKDLEVVPCKYRIGFHDDRGLVVLGDHEWQTFKQRSTDASKEVVDQLNAFMENEFNKQLHWSALRLFTAVGVLDSELASMEARLNFIARNPAPGSEDAARLADWISGHLMPLVRRISSRLQQVISRVLTPERWTLRGDIGAHGGPGGGGVQLAMSFKPLSEAGRKEEDQRIERLKRLIA